MEKFIEEALEKEFTNPNPPQNDGNFHKNCEKATKNGKNYENDDCLYQIPEKYREVPKSDPNANQDKPRGALAEVEIPISDKIENVRRTEKLKKKFLESETAFFLCLNIFVFSLFRLNFKYFYNFFLNEGRIAI